MAPLRQSWSVPTSWKKRGVARPGNSPGGKDQNMPTKRKTGKSRYGKAAGKKVGAAMHERKSGKLRSGSGKRVKSRKQAIAIGLSQARKAGGKVPAKAKGRRKSSSK